MIWDCIHLHPHPVGQKSFDWNHSYICGVCPPWAQVKQNMLWPLQDIWHTTQLYHHKWQGRGWRLGHVMMMKTWAYDDVYHYVPKGEWSTVKAHSTLSHLSIMPTSLTTNWNRHLWFSSSACGCSSVWYSSGDKTEKDKIQSDGPTYIPFRIMTRT